MLSDPLAAVFTAATVALLFVLANVFQKEIADVFAAPTSFIPPGSPDDRKAGRPMIDPIGHFITLVPQDHRIAPRDPPTQSDLMPLFPLPTHGPSGAISVRPTPTILRPPKRPASTASGLPSTIPDPTISLPHRPGKDEYHLYTGDGSIAAGWPHKADWVSYSEMFTTNIPLIIGSCKLYSVTPDSLPEIVSIHHATLTISVATNTDPRFILAVILQESSGCVRVPTSFYSLRNPGLMQSHNGPATCNEDASPIYPCPYERIEEMIREGTAGTFEGKGMGLVVALRNATVDGKVDDVGRYYRAARIYNSGEIDASGDLGKGVATHCYASDIANRLRGWSLADDGCAEGRSSVIGGSPEIRELKILIVLVIIAAVSLGQIHYLSLPIPEATAIATLLLPILTAIGIQGSQSLIARSHDPPSKRPTLPYWLLPTLFLFLTVYDAVLATLAFTYLLLSDTQECELLTRWEHMFHNHDVGGLQRIQDAHQCCGLRTTRHMPWPFPDVHGANACRNTYHRERSCLGSLRRDLQVNAGMVLLVALVSFSVKAIVLFLYRGRSNPLTQHVRRGYAALTNDDNDTENGIRRSNEARGRIEAPYRDDPGTENDGSDQEETTAGEVQRDDRRGARRHDTNMVVQPSTIQGDGNEWRS
ncbi:MAG: hypothetical protein Q9213_006607 [Squamulea squamosa]